MAKTEAKNAKGVPAMTWLDLDTDERVKAWIASQLARTSRSAALAALVAAGLAAQGYGAAQGRKSRASK